MLYIVALRQFTAAANIPGMIDTVVEFLQKLGSYNLAGYERYIPSPTTCKRRCQFMTQHLVDIQLAVEFHCGNFWRSNLCMFRDGSSVNGQSVETIGSIQRVGNSKLPPLQWDDPEVFPLNKMQTKDLRTLLTHRGGSFKKRDSRDFLVQKLRALPVQLTRSTVDKMSRDSLRFECEMITVSWARSMEREEVGRLYNQRLKHREREDDVEANPRKTKRGQIAQFESLVWGTPRIAGKDQHSMFDAIAHRVDTVKAKQLVLFEGEISETSNPLDQHQFTMTDKCSSEDCVNLLLSKHTEGAARLAMKESALKCMQHALCSDADGYMEYFTRFRERPGFMGYVHGAIFAYWIISQLVATDSNYEHNVIENFAAWCASAAGGGGRSINIKNYSLTRSHHNVQNIRSVLVHFDEIKRFFETLGAENKKAKEIEGFFEDEHSVVELLVYKFWEEKYFRPMQGLYINANVPYLEGADAFRMAWRTKQTMATQSSSLWSRLLVNGVEAKICPFSPNTESERVGTDVDMFTRLVIGRAAWEALAAGSTFDDDDTSEPTVEENYGMWESLIEDALSGTATHSETSFFHLFRRHRAQTAHFSEQEACARYEAVVLGVSESIHWSVTYSQSRVEASLVDGVLNVSKLRQVPGIDNAPCVNDPSESNFGVVKYVAQQLHRADYETVDAMTTFLLNRTFEFFLKLQTEDPLLFEKCLDHLEGLSLRSLFKKREEDRKADSEKLMSKLIEKKELKEEKEESKKKRENKIKEENTRWESVSDMEQALADCTTQAERQKLVLGQIRLIKLELPQRVGLSPLVVKNVKRSLQVTLGGKPRAYSVVKRSVREFVHCHNHDEWDSFAESEEREQWIKIVKHQHKLWRNKKKSNTKKCAECDKIFWDHWGCARCGYFLCDSCLDEERLPVAGARNAGKKRKRSDSDNVNNSNKRRRKANDKGES